ncbi:Protein fluG [Ilyonectria robusta]
MDSHPSQDEGAFLHAVRTTPIIDNHAHPLLRPAARKNTPLLSITTEAEGSALDATTTSLAHLRAVKQLSYVLGCEPTWDSVSTALEKKQQNTNDYENWIRTCLSGIHSILVDDHLGNQGDNEAYDYFDKFTPAESKRIVRVEHVATILIEEACTEQNSPETAFSSFIRSLNHAISQDILDPVVVGFKSAISYRTGLAIPQHPDQDKAFGAFQEIHYDRQRPGAKPFNRLQHNGLNEYVVHCLASLISESAAHPKPIQFHTGLGDNDITLTKASPSHLQQFIAQYPTVPIVLLHSGYPFVRDTGYLATVYANVYADIGEVFPMVSRDGQETIVRQILEICPSSKVIWSTDGHWFPETYLLAVVQMREAFETVLCEYVRKGDLSWQQAKKVVEDILFHNSNKLYGLSLSMDSPSLSLTPKSESDLPKCNAEWLVKLLSNDSSVQSMRLCWHDYTGTTRLRITPIRRVMSLLQSKKTLEFGVAKAALSVLQTDHMVDGISPAGEWDLCADFASLRMGPRDGHVTLMGDFREKDGSQVTICPRTVLRNTLKLAAALGFSFLLGFEVEFVLLRRTGPREFSKLDGDAHAWAVAGATDHSVVATVIEEAMARLDKAGIYVETMHPESSFGQYEIVLPAAPALEAVDSLLFARQVISSCANAHGYKMTLHPKPFAETPGTAAHVHMSISSAGGSDPSVYNPFYAGILRHLRSIIAFTCSSPVSYARIVDSCWAGGTWVAWGTQNRETPLRKIRDSHWELKCIDGLANPYLAMAAILASGLDGILNRHTLSWKDCTEDPASLTPAQRANLNITENLPSTLDEALHVLGQDEQLHSLLGGDSVERYIAVKQQEISSLSGMDSLEQKQWVIESRLHPFRSWGVEPRHAELLQLPYTPQLCNPGP